MKLFGFFPKVVLVSLLVCGLLVTASVVSAASSVSKCSKIGATKVVKGVSFRCVTTSKGKVWQEIKTGKTVVPLTCANGGLCRIGDTGPGGGKVFYVASDTFAQIGASGSMCTTTCRYLEAAPENWLSGTTGDPVSSWANSGNMNALVTGAKGTEIGSGYQNSLDIANQAGNVAANSAAVLVRTYGGGGKTDWFLPSRAELWWLLYYKDAVGGIWIGHYWTSSEGAFSSAWGIGFSSGFIPMDGKNSMNYVRPVRAF